MKIPITPIKGSEQIHGLGYDPATKVLAVQFHKREKGQIVGAGAAYHYEGFPQEKMNQFVTAESKGTFFRERVKNQYPHQKQPEGGAQ